MVEELYNIDLEVKKILNKNNDEPIILLANNQIPTRFEKVALVPYKKGLYVILSPMDYFPKIKKDDKLVMQILKGNDNLFNLFLPSDDKLSEKIKKIYNNKITHNKIFNFFESKKQIYIFKHNY